MLREAERRTSVQNRRERAVQNTNDARGRTARVRAVGVMMCVSGGKVDSVR